MLTKHHIPNNVAEISFGPLPLTSGKCISSVTLRYELTGPPGAPVILVCHALTGNHRTVGTEENPGWWSGLIGPHKYIDTTQYQVLTFNVLGGCNGSTGPTSLNPKTNKPYRRSFPEITIRDMVTAQYMALQKLNISKLYAVIGGSLGGMQVLEWGICYPEMMVKLIAFAVTPVFSDYGIGFNHIAEQAIKTDPAWNNGNYPLNTPLKGLEIARMIGMVTYRSVDLFTERFQRQQSETGFSVSSYLNYQGAKLANRFDPNSYLYLLNAMNHHDIGHGRGGWKKAARLLRKPTLLISYEKDLIYEPHIIRSFAEQLPQGHYFHVETNFGHDGFLTEFEKWGDEVASFLHGA